MKKIFTLAIVLITIKINAQIPTSGLLGYYPFNGNANDQSGNSNNGIVTGATLTSDRFGNPNSAYNFPNSIDNIQIPTITESNILKYSISGWFKKSASSSNTEGNIFCGSHPLDTNGLRFHIGSDNNASWGVEYTTGSVWSHSQNQNYADNTWHFFTVVLNGDSGVVDSTELLIYIDNLQVPVIQQTWGNASSVILPIDNQNLPTVLGNVNGLNDNFNGVLDDIRIYNRVLNTNEIASLYNEGICYSYISVTDTLVINTLITSYNPITYANTIKVFPNPTNDHITINYGNFSTLNGYSIKITNSLGQIMFSSSINQQQSYIDLSTWSGNGLYFLHLIDSTNNIVDIKKIVLQ